MDERNRKRSGQTSRRGFLATTAAFAISEGIGRAHAFAEEESGVEVDLIRKRAEALGLGTVRSITGPTYLVVGDAPEPFLRQALKLCEDLAVDYLDHFARRGFPVRKPEERLSVVALSSPQAFSAFVGAEEDDAVGGHYDLDTNRLVIFDNRRRANAGPMVERANTVALMHEAMHQITYNTGLLQRGRPVPLAINEGLGTYAESRRPDGRTPIGRLNEARVAVLSDAARSRRPWITTADLLFTETPFTQPDLVQQAYGQSWLLVFHLLQEPKRTPQFQRYLAGPGADPSTRNMDSRSWANDCFGGLGDLDTELRSRLQRPARR